MARRRLPATARLAIRVAGVAALAAGGVVLGRGVVGLSNTRPSLLELAGASARPAQAFPSVAVDAAGRPTFSSSIRSWAAAAAPSQQEQVQAIRIPEPAEPIAAVAAENPAALATGGAQRVDPAPEEDKLVPGGRQAVSAPAAETRNTQPAPIQVPSTPSAPPLSVVAGQGATTPDAAVRDFYAYLEQGQFDRAAGVWSQRMRSAYPPAEYINSRFARTQSLSLARADVVELDNAKGRATVAIRLSEVIGPPTSTRQYVGTWSVVRGPNGWFLDQPNLRLS